MAAILSLEYAAIAVMIVVTIVIFPFVGQELQQFII